MSNLLGKSYLWVAYYLMYIIIPSLQVALRAGVDYGEEVHRLVKNFNLEQGYLRQKFP
jgi:hypothetical protein